MLPSIENQIKPEIASLSKVKVRSPKARVIRQEINKPAIEIISKTRSIIFTLSIILKHWSVIFINNCRRRRCSLFQI